MYRRHNYYWLVHFCRDEYYSGFVNETVKEITKEIECRKTMFSSSHGADNSSNGLISFEESKNAESHSNDLRMAMEVFPDLTEHDIKVVSILILDY